MARRPLVARKAVDAESPKPPKKAKGKGRRARGRAFKRKTANRPEMANKRLKAEKGGDVDLYITPESKTEAQIAPEPITAVVTTQDGSLIRNAIRRKFNIPAHLYDQIPQAYDMEFQRIYRFIREKPKEAGREFSDKISRSTRLDQVSSMLYKLMQHNLSAEESDRRDEQLRMEVAEFKQRMGETDAGDDEYMPPEEFAVKLVESVHKTLAESAK